MALKITTRNKLGIAIIEARGSIIGGFETDELTRAALDLIEQGNRRLIVDLSNTSFVNSAGLGAMVGIHRLYSSKGGRVVLCGLDQRVLNVFVLTSLTRVVDVEESRSAALALLQV